LAILKFIFTFRSVTKEQIKEFAKIELGISNVRRLVEYCVREKYIGDYLAPPIEKHTYYLLERGKSLLEEEVPVEIYRFRKGQINLASYNHDALLVEIYFLLRKFLKVQDWIGEWILRFNRKKGGCVPDGLLILNNSLRMAIELERTRKRMDKWRHIVRRYKVNIKAGNCQGILLVAINRSILDVMTRRVFNIVPKLTEEHFFVTTFGLLRAGKVAYKKAWIDVKNMPAILEKVNSV